MTKLWFYELPYNLPILCSILTVLHNYIFIASSKALNF
jgi:DMSO/TMAO reductase YedYZ heme-binding membrane subunit